MRKKKYLRPDIRDWVHRIGKLEATTMLINIGIPASTVSKLLTGNYDPKQPLLINALKEAMKEVS